MDIEERIASLSNDQLIDLWDAMERPERFPEEWKEGLAEEASKRGLQLSE